MPRPEQTPAPSYQGLPYGTNALANDQSQDLPDASVDDEAYDEMANATPDPGQEFLLSPTDRPNEPFTQGMPFGPGTNAPARVLGNETRQQFGLRVANMLRQSPEQTPGLKTFVQRIERGL